MTAVEATDFFLLPLCERTGGTAAIDVDAFAAAEAQGVLVPTALAYVHELKVHGWIDDCPGRTVGALQVRLTEAGASRYVSERTRCRGINGPSVRGSGS